MKNLKNLKRESNKKKEKNKSKSMAIVVDGKKKKKKTKNHIKLTVKTKSLTHILWLYEFIVDDGEVPPPSPRYR